jgi:hypothetical protein
MNVTVDQLFLKIARLVIQVDLLVEENLKLQAQIKALTPQASPQENNLTKGE